MAVHMSVGTLIVIIIVCLFLVAIFDTIADQVRLKRAAERLKKSGVVTKLWVYTDSDDGKVYLYKNAAGQNEIEIEPNYMLNKYGLHYTPVEAGIEEIVIADVYILDGTTIFREDIS